MHDRVRQRWIHRDPARTWADDLHGSSAQVRVLAQERKTEDMDWITEMASLARDVGSFSVTYGDGRYVVVVGGFEGSSRKFEDAFNIAVAARDGSLADASHAAWIATNPERHNP